MNTGVFACLVMENSPASKSGVRFGDQILQIDGVDMVGMQVDKVHKIFKGKSPGAAFELAIRDR
jgi:syntenin-1